MTRSDKRAFNRLRPIKITPDFNKYAEGSCLIELGNTKVICTASVEESVPIFLRNKGTGWVTAEYGMIPRSCKKRIQRANKTGGRTAEIQRLIGRSLRTVTDLTKIGERTIWIDADVIQADGGTRTASITGSFIALVKALNKLKDDGAINEIPLSDFVAATSVGIFDGQPILDLDYNEDSRAQVDMNIVMTSSGKFIEIQGTAERNPFDRKSMDELLDLAKLGIDNLICIQKDLLKGVFS
ncbi:MAG TPA: ribonuclease PH [Candidatus Omnitrophica bacterium]|nr:ribonuclease PH [Candidatus Omnitrophota bacterium]